MPVRAPVAANKDVRAEIGRRVGGLRIGCAGMGGCVVHGKLRGKGTGGVLPLEQIVGERERLHA